MSNFFDNVKVPKIVKPISMGDYDESMADAPPVFVWVNPDQDMLTEYREFQLKIAEAEKMMYRAIKGAKRFSKIKSIQSAYLKRATKKINEANDRNREWLAAIWSQGAPETHVNAADVKRTQEHIIKTDGALWLFLVNQTYSMILAHNNRAALEKN